jgi:hypothetical protein
MATQLSYTQSGSVPFTRYASPIRNAWTSTTQTTLCAAIDATRSQSVRVSRLIAVTLLR